MRPSKKHDIIAAAITIIDEHGPAAVTLDEAAARAGVSKGGLLYHFSTRRALMLSIHEHLAHQWQKQLEKIAGGPANKVDEATRTRAYLITMVEDVTRTELVVSLEAAEDEEALAFWQAVGQNWLPAAPLPGEKPSGAYIACLAAEGLWIRQATGALKLSQAARSELVGHLTKFID